jgi:hypothetical protein
LKSIGVFFDRHPGCGLINRICDRFFSRSGLSQCNVGAQRLGKPLFPVLLLPLRRLIQFSASHRFSFGRIASCIILAPVMDEFANQSKTPVDALAQQAAMCHKPPALKGQLR